MKINDARFERKRNDNLLTWQHLLPGSALCSQNGIGTMFIHLHRSSSYGTHDLKCSGNARYHAQIHIDCVLSAALLCLPLFQVLEKASSRDF